MLDRLLFTLLIPGLLAGSSACAEPEPGPATPISQAFSTTRYSLSDDTESIVVPWGEAPGSPGLRTGAQDHHATGPQAVAPLPGGGYAILDIVNRMIVLVDDRGTFVSSFPVSPLAVDLAVAPGGTIAILNLSALNVLVHSQDGSLLQTYPLPAEATTATAIVHSDGGWLLQTMHQQTIRVEAPHPVSSLTDGFPVGGGRRLALMLGTADRVQVVESAPPLLKGLRQNQVVVSGWNTDCDAVRLLGGLGNDGEVVAYRCDKVETSDLRPVVSQHVDLVAADGNHLLRLDLPDSLYEPFRRVRLTGQDLIVMTPQSDGLSIARTSLDSREVN
jgi:hypothetical protein